MKILKTKLKSYLGKLSNWLDSLTKAQIIAIIVIAIGLLIFMMAALLGIQGLPNGQSPYPAFSGMPYAIAKALVGCAILKLVDEIMLYEIPTMQNLKQSATGYALYMLGYAVIIALAIATA